MYVNGRHSLSLILYFPHYLFLTCLVVLGILRVGVDINVVGPKSAVFAVAILKWITHRPNMVYIPVWFAI